MAKLTAADRRAVPKGEFGLPAEGKYPMPDKGHAANAKARATQMVAKGKLSASAEHKIDEKANRVLGEPASRGEHRTGTHLGPHRSGYGR